MVRKAQYHWGWDWGPRLRGCGIWKDVSLVRVPSARALVYADKRANPNGRLPDDTWILRPQDLPHGFDTMDGMVHQ